MIGALLDRLRHAKLRNPGRHGEDLAHRYLKKRGYTIVARNYRLAAGDAEADVIAWDGPELAIVEVKSRETAAYGSPDRAVGKEKMRHLMRVAREYSRRANIPLQRVRFDVVTVILSSPPQIELYRGKLRSSSDRN